MNGGLAPHSSTNCRLCFYWGSGYQHSVCSATACLLLRRVPAPSADASGSDNRGTVVYFWLSGPCGCGIAAHAAGLGSTEGTRWLGEGAPFGCRLDYWVQGVVNSRGSPIGEFSSWWAQPVTVASVPDGHRWHGYVLHIPPSSPHTYTLLKPCQPAGIQVRILPRLGNPSCLAWSGPGHACPTGQQA